MLLMFGPWGVTYVHGMGHALAKVCIKKEKLIVLPLLYAKWYSMGNAIPLMVSYHLILLVSVTV